MLKKCKTGSGLELLTELPVVVSAPLLVESFGDYTQPRKKIFDLVQKKYLHHYRRGHYLNLKSNQFHLTPKESIANALCFPSYVSLEWALQYYGLLTERVHGVTSVTLRKNQHYPTPLGVFSYEHLHKGRYPFGYSLKTTPDGSFLVATPLKAFLDYINLRVKNPKWAEEKDYDSFLVDDLRLDLESFLSLIDLSQIEEAKPYYHRNSNESKMLRWLKSKVELEKNESS